MTSATQPVIPYNFSPATARPGEILHGCMRPGSMEMGAQKVTKEELVAWSDDMKARGISRVIGLLSQEEIESGYEIPPAELFTLDSKNGLVAFNVNEAEYPKSVDSVMKLVDTAEKAGEKVALHCWGGSGRTGTMLAALAMKRYGLTLDQATGEILAYSESVGAKREFKLKNLQTIV